MTTINGITPTHCVWWHENIDGQTVRRHVDFRSASAARMMRGRKQCTMPTNPVFVSEIKTLLWHPQNNKNL